MNVIETRIWTLSTQNAPVQNYSIFTGRCLEKDKKSICPRYTVLQKMHIVCWCAGKTCSP